MITSPEARDKLQHYHSRIAHYYDEATAPVALDHLTEAGSLEEKANAKVQLSHQLSDIGEIEKSSRYIAEFQSMSLDGFGRWVADQADHLAANDMYSDLEKMITCWQTQRAGDLEAFAIKLQEIGG